MDRRFLAIAALVTLLALAGCSSYLNDAGGEPGADELATVSPDGGAVTPTETPDESGTPTDGTTPTDDGPTTVTATDSGTPAGTATDDGPSTATATEEEWSTPEPPNTPLERKPNKTGGDRIVAVESESAGTFAEPAADVPLSVTANTSMPNVDPPRLGTARGEPYFVVYVNATLEPGGEWAGSTFNSTTGTLAVRQDSLRQVENGTFEMAIPEEAFEAEGVDAGEVEVLVLLMDEDKQWDDIYGKEWITVEYVPSETDDRP